MSSISEKKLLTNSEVIRLIGGIILIVSAWGRMEYKFNETTFQLLKKMDEHITIDREEKKAINKDISQLQEKLSTLQIDAKEYFKNEFIRPSEPKFENERRGRRWSQ